MFVPRWDSIFLHFLTRRRKKSSLFRRNFAFELENYFRRAGKHAKRRGEMKIASMLHYIHFPLIYDVFPQKANKTTKRGILFWRALNDKKSFRVGFGVVDSQKWLAFSVCEENVIPKSSHCQATTEEKRYKKNINFLLRMTTLGRWAGKTAFKKWKFFGKLQKQSSNLHWKKKQLNLLTKVSQSR